MLRKHFFVIHTLTQSITIETVAHNWGQAEAFASETRDALEDNGITIAAFARDYELSHVSSPGHEPGTLYDCPGCVEQLGEHDLVLDLRIGQTVRVEVTPGDTFTGRIESGHAGQWFVRSSETGELTGPWDADDLRKL